MTTSNESLESAGRSARITAGEALACASGVALALAGWFSIVRSGVTSPAYHYPLLLVAVIATLAATNGWARRPGERELRTFLGLLVGLAVTSLALRMFA